ncbi:MAG: UvrD-helicase domain-containing protein [Clostridiales bacterium]|nr:UvrD-helicase domain-containing protein [Clostridiales bacterium]
MKKFTPSQQNVIDFRGKNMLVSASAGAGKTTVMIERIVSLIEQGVDVSEMVVVTFTNLAAAEMKSRLADKLAEKRNDPRIVEQLEKLETASICTLHSFCNELLRNYFYVVDVDPAFTILDNVTLSTLTKNALDDVIEGYFAEQDDVFRRVYKIFATKRREENFKKTLLDLYRFSRCLDDFSAWYAEKRVNFVQYGETNPIVTTFLNDVRQTVSYCKSTVRQLIKRAADVGQQYVDLFTYCDELLSKIDTDTLQNAIFGLCKTQLPSLPRKQKNIEFDEVEGNLRQNYTDIKEEFDGFVKKYSKLCRGEEVETLWQEMVSSTEYVDKLVEIIGRFDEQFYQAKKQRGGVDFNDLEHLTLQLLKNEEALAEIKSRYKHIFVDEYQDTNPVQEAIVSRLETGDNLFMVGDVKQSIYGFRGCEPSIFVDKYERYKATDEGRVEELNDNFRSNYQILDFVNRVFNAVMTSSFGKVDYEDTAQLRGITPPTLNAPSTRVDLLLQSDGDERELDTLYDLTDDASNESGVKQGELIARRIKEYLGMKYYDAKDGKEKVISYGDVVILMRSLTDKALDVYNTLISHNIPVSAGFKVNGFANKEVRDFVNLLRVIDNPYNDLYLIGACLSFGGLTEKELGLVRLDTEGRIPFYERLQNYTVSSLNVETVRKIEDFLEFLRKMRFYSRSASVCEIALKVLEEMDYYLYVQGLPNGGMRLKKLYAFIDSIKDASYGQSVDKFLAYVDETEDNAKEEGLSNVNAVRLMTMHASKGLEFPVLIVAGVETRFPFMRFSKPLLEKNTDLGLAIRHYNFGNMRVADTLGWSACGMVNGVKQREEEMRLLYVALTRAKYVLHVVGTVTGRQLNALPKLPSNARTHLDWLMPTVKQYAEKAEDGVEVNIIDKLPDEDERASESNLCEQTVSLHELERSLSFEYRYAAETRMPAKIVSSALDKEYLDVAEEPRAEHVLNVNNDRNFVGTAYHKVYQYVNYDATKEQILETISQLVHEGKIEQKFAEQLDAQLIYDTLNNPALKKLVSGGKTYHEIPFMLYVPYDKVAKDKRFSDEVMLQGVIDLLVVDGNRATVIDFKYTSRSDLVEQNYAAQLNSYRLAVKQICGIDDVDCYVLSIADNKLISM